MSLSKIYQAVILSVCIQYCNAAEKNYVEITNPDRWNYDSELDLNSIGDVGYSIPNYVNGVTSTGMNVILITDETMFKTDDGYIYLLDNDKVTIDPEKVVKGVGVKVFPILTGRYLFQLKAYDTNGESIGAITKDQSFTKEVTNKNIFLGLESTSVNIDKVTVDLSNTKNQTKRFSLASVNFIENVISKTNNITVIEGIPAVLTSDINGRYFQWFKNGELLQWETNNFLKIDHPLEADGGDYVLNSGSSSVTFNISFQRNIKILVNEKEIEGDVAEIPELSIASNIKLIPFINGLPIRYTLDGSEPTEQSPLYTGPFNISSSGKTLGAKKQYLRAKIIIPETDSTTIKFKKGTLE